MGDPPVLAVVVEADGAAGAATVRVCGEVDIATVAELRAGLEKAATGRPRRLVVDLAATTFIDASGMNAIAWARRAHVLRSWRLGTRA